MEQSCRFRGASGKEYEYLSTPLDELDRVPMRSGTYVVAAIGRAGPTFLYCREARCLRDELLAAGLAEQRKVSPRLALALYVHPCPDCNKAARDAEVDDIMIYYRCAVTGSRREAG